MTVVNSCGVNGYICGTVLYHIELIKCCVKQYKIAKVLHMCSAILSVSALHTHSTCSFVLNNVVNIYILFTYSMYVHKGIM